MKALAGFLFLLAISFVVNALMGRWALSPGTHKGEALYVVLDLVLAAVCAYLSLVAWRRGEYGEIVRRARDDDR